MENFPKGNLKRRRELRIGVLGLGRAGSGMLSALAHHPNIRVTAAADLYPQHLEKFKSEFGGETFFDAADLCRSKSIDAVYIATPHELHVEHFLMAAQAGKHAIVEKPMALTMKDCDAMIEASESLGIHLIVGHTASFNPSVQKMRQLIIQEEFGGLAFLTATSYTDFLYRPRRPEELVTELGGGIMYNQIPHQIDAVRFIAGGMVRSVKASIYDLDPQRHTEGSCLAFLDFSNGVSATLTYSGYDHFESSELSNNQGPKNPFEYGSSRRKLSSVSSVEDEKALRVDTGFGGVNSVYRSQKIIGTESLLQGELGSFLITCEKGDLRMLPDGIGAYSDQGYELITPDPWLGMQGRGAVIEELYHAIFADRKIVHDGRWAKATMEVCIAMLESAKTKKEISLEFQVPTIDI